MDELDNKIIQLLQVDGRASNAKIARSAAVSEGTVRRRLHSMINEGIVKIVGIPDLQKIGYTTAAMVGLQVDPGKVHDVADTAADFPETQYISINTGPYDIFVWVAVTSHGALTDFLNDKIGSIPGVRRTETFINLANKKPTHGLAS